MVDTIYLIRHCEAEGNIYRRVHGHYDGHPMPNGQAQCRALAERFKDVQLSAIYASDLTRARYTAGFLAAPRGMAVQINPAFKEINLGVWEDCTWGETTRDYPTEKELFNHRLWEFSIPDGETLVEVQTRFITALDEVRAQHNGAIAIVSHGMALRCAVAALMKLPLNRVDELSHGDNTSVTRVDYAPDGTPTVQYYADNSHLGELSTLAKQKWWRDSGSVDIEVCFDAVDVTREGDKVDQLRRDAWQAVYGSMKGFCSDTTAAETVRCAHQHPRAVVFARRRDEVIGLLLLDTEYKADEGLGHISLVTLAEHYRGKGLGLQLIGHAISVYRALGRKALHLRVADSNTRAIQLYKRLGFEQVGVEQAELRPLLVMQKSLLPPALQA